MRGHSAGPHAYSLDSSSAGPISARPSIISLRPTPGSAPHRRSTSRRISVTSLLGGQSRALTDLFSGPARNWNFTPAAALPIFDAGSIRSRVRFAEAVYREALARYEKSIQTAFREVADALIDHHKTREQRAQQERLVKALRETVRLSTLRYRGGLDSYLQVLDAERNLFRGELTLARLRRRELAAIAELYRALGGGRS